MLQKITTPLDPNPIHSAPKTPFTTTVGKLVGLVTILILAFVFIIKSIEIFDKQVIYVNSKTYQSNNQTNRNTILNITNSIAFIDMYHQSEGKFMDRVDFKDQFKYGINGTIQLSEFSTGKRTIVKLADCTQKGWVSTYCLPDNVPLQISYAQKYVEVKISPCQKSISPQCVQPSGQYQINFYLINTITNPFDHTYQNITDYDIVFKSYRYKVGQAQKITYEIDEINIESDQSVFPIFSDQRSQTNYRIDMNQQKSILDYYVFNLEFRVSTKVINYERSYKKIDVALAEVLAISTVLGLLCRLAFSGYNNWVYERYIISKEMQKQSRIDQQQLQKYRVSNNGFINYVKWQFSKNQDKKQQQQLFKAASDQQNIIIKSVIKAMNKELSEISQQFSRMEMEIEELRNRGCECSCRGCEKKQKKVHRDQGSSFGAGRSTKRRKFELMINYQESSLSRSLLTGNSSLNQRLI